MVSSAELQLINDNSQPENDKEASGGDSPKVRPAPKSTHLIPQSTTLPQSRMDLLKKKPHSGSAV